ncbi:MAG: hypothetical protein JKY42_02505 [Flavobacteriales bacterium]|nr:hypothetical protein [Flavobacteriales bacterium]
MQLSKIVISLFLLLTYVVGFGHNVVHHHHDGAAHNHVETHHHHDYKIGKENHHEHVAHGSHYDDSLYDLIVCFLSEEEHSSEACEVNYYVHTKTSRTINTSVARQIGILVSTFNFFSRIHSSNLNCESANYIAIAYLSPSIDNSPHRGPPAFTA